MEPGATFFMSSPLFLHLLAFQPQFLDFFGHLVDPIPYLLIRLSGVVNYLPLIEAIA